MNLINHLKYLVFRLLNKNFLKFIFIGAINTFFGYIIFFILVFLNFVPELAIFCATLIGLFFNLYTYSNYFYKRKISIAIFLKFTFNYSIIYITNIIFFYIFNLMFDKYISQLFCIPFIVLLNWFSLKYFVYK